MLKLSVITVCRNEEAGIAKTAESIVHQTWQDFEWIVIDGASTDGTLDKLEPYAGRISRLVSEPDSGIYNAMNKGIRLAQGEYLIFMNGGDTFHHLEVLEEVFCQKNLNGDVLYGDCIHVTPKKEIHWKPSPSIPTASYFITNNIPHPSSFIKRELFERYGMYDETLKIVGDWKHWIIFALNSCTFQYTKTLVSLFNKGGISEHRNDIRQLETASVITAYFHAGELDGLNRDAIVIWYKLVGLIPFVKLKKKRRKTRYLLFGIIPFLCAVR